MTNDEDHRAEIDSLLVDEDDVGQEVSPSEGEPSSGHRSSSVGKGNFDNHLQQTLAETKQAVLQFQGGAHGPDFVEGWGRAASIVKEFRPVPWFMWRISNYVLGRSGSTGDVSEGLVYGLRRLLFGLASDPIIGTGEKVTSVRKAIQVVSPDVIAAVSVIHAVCRRLATHENERIWKPVLDEALLRAQLAYEIGKQAKHFDCGRAMLTGFTSRIGFAVLIASGESEEATEALELLASGESLQQSGYRAYECYPLQVSALLLSAMGVNRDAAFGFTTYALRSNTEPESLKGEQPQWFSALHLIEALRSEEQSTLSEKALLALGCNPSREADLLTQTKTLARKGHTLTWLIG
ncbi:hypothetical protein MRY87_03865 [bacterium]|nr:hypothetical protein [bacterium]